MIRRTSWARDQVVVDLPRAAQGIADGLFGDFVEDQPVDGHLRLEDLAAGAN